MSETNGKSLNGSLNGRAPRDDDIDAAAELLYEALAMQPWFVGVITDHAARRLMIETRDLKTALAWAEGWPDWLGYALEVHKSRWALRMVKASS